LGELVIAFQKTTIEDTGGIWFTLRELDGVSDDVLSTLEKGTGENEGKVR